MLVLSEPSQGGEMWKKKGEVVYLWCDLSTQENTVCVWHGKHTQWKESLLFTSGNSKHFCLCVGTLENVWLLKTVYTFVTCMAKYVPAAFVARARSAP